MVVVDAGSNFLAIFESMCNVLNIQFHATAKSNHKAVSVERYFWFVNKATTIAINDRDDPHVWVPAAMTAGYAWNSAPIDGTDIRPYVVLLLLAARFRFRLIFHYPFHLSHAPTMLLPLLST
jgi:hypothetical protein